MVLSRLIVRWLEWIIEIGLWITLIAAFLTGVQIGNGFFGSLISGVISVVGAGVLSAVVFGFFIVLNDIRQMMKAALNQQNASSR